MNVVIRRATLADAPVLAALEAACFAEPWSLADVASDLRQNVSRAWLAELDGIAVGYLLGSQVVDEFTVARVASAPKARRSGVGRALLDHAVTAAQGQGVTVVFLEVRAGNVAAIRLYETAGFVVTRRRKGYYQDGEDALDMRWDLT